MKNCQYCQKLFSSGKNSERYSYCTPRCRALRRNEVRRTNGRAADKSAANRFVGSVVFPLDLAEDIRAIAKRDRTNFAETVRLLCEWGLEADAMP